MRNKIPYRRRIDYQNSAEDRRVLSLYWQSGILRKKQRLNELEDSARRNRIILYGLAGAVFLTGLFFIFF